MLKIASWNMQGAINQKQELGELVHSHNLDVIALQETLLSAGNRYTLSGYNTYRNRNRRGGDTAILVRNKLQHHQLLAPADLQQAEATGVGVYTRRYGGSGSSQCTPNQPQDQQWETWTLCYRRRNKLSSSATSTTNPLYGTQGPPTKKGKV